MTHACVRLTFLAGAAPLALLAPPAAAQVAAPVALASATPAASPEAAPVDAADDASLDVVVTARRREERAQDVPIALSVVGNEQLAARGDFRLDQVQQLVPSLQVFSFNPRNTNINIRGLGSNVALTNDGLENGVGIYIDNVYYGRVGQSQFDLVDLDRVEVLRGPQGTLFGKNTTAGAINISSKLPRFDWGFEGQADLGNYDFKQLRGSLTGPIKDGLAAFRLSGAYTDRSGFLYDTTTKRDVHDYRNITLRGRLLLTPASGLSIRLIGDWGKQDQNCCINVLVGSFNNYDNGAAIANNFASRIARAGYTPLPFAPFSRRTDANSPFQANMNTWGVSGEVNYDLGRATITSITALRNWNWFPLNDGDYTALAVNLQGHINNFQRQFSQELRIASNGTNTVDYVAGLYYFFQKVRGVSTAQFGPDAASYLFPADLAGGVANIATNGLLSQGRSDPHTRSFAAFGQTVWHITPALTLTTGLRFTHEDKWGGYSNQILFALPTTGLNATQTARVAAIRASLAPATSFNVSTRNDSLSGLATLGWKPGKDVLLYATYSRGSKSQGLNLTTIPAGVSPIVAPERVDNFELGVKSQFFDRAVTLNLAAYSTTVANYQTTIVQQLIGTNTYINYIANIPKVRSRGFEGDVAWQVAPHLGLTGSLAYTDAIYTDYPNGPAPVENLNRGAVQNMTGQPLAGVPKWSAALGGDGSVPLRDGVEGYAHADWSYRSSYYTVASNSRYGLVPSYGVVNARLGVRFDHGRYDVSIWARNLFDRDYYQTLSVLNYGLVTATLGDPRTFGGTFRVKF
ncbi:TonB-dependent receptor [Sphingomonas sp. TX0543]|uniref:TonB-dependent receptor n=1 Tax=unclassified Sphingomonas TaxID=196159 RepID=UPI0010F6B9EB|nr:TonB-dependent receptor [Sphingomonas sp. 3P27F8]